jgi:hypothetical protein
LQFSFAAYLIPHPPGHKICTSSFATYLIPHPQPILHFFF